jgi:hypothetical protein
MIYLLAYRLSNGKQALAVSNENTFVGTENLEEAKNLIPHWNGYHVAGMTWSTSATLYWMSYHPHIVQFNTMDEVAEILKMTPENTITKQHTAWGSARYTIISDEAKLNVAFDPKLIDEGVDSAKPFYEK